MEYQRGQILLIVVLVMVTALTVGLSVAARTVSNLRTAQEASNSEQAFSAAEAGIEQSLTNNTSVRGAFPNQATYQTNVKNIAGVEFPLNNGSPVLKDDAVDIWLSTYPSYTNPWTGTITLYWGQAGDACTSSEATNTMPALEVVLITGSLANPQESRYALDGCAARNGINKFESVPAGGGTVAGKTYTFRRTMSITAGLFMRVIPLYAPAFVGVRGCDSAGNNCLALPAQGTIIEATGVSSNTTRKLVSTRYYPKLPPELFPYSFFSPQ
jgi:Tfp pilus assembly protein PilX